MEHIKISPTLKYVTFSKVSACSSIAISFTFFSTNYTLQILSWVIKSHSATNLFPTFGMKVHLHMRFQAQIVAIMNTINFVH